MYISHHGSSTVGWEMQCEHFKQKLLAPAHTVTGQLCNCVTRSLSHTFCPLHVSVRSVDWHSRFPTNATTNYSRFWFKTSGKSVLREQREEIIWVTAATNASACVVCRRTEVGQQFCRIINAIELCTHRQRPCHLTSV